MEILQSEVALIIALLLYFALKPRPTHASSAVVPINSQIELTTSQNVSVRRGSPEGFEHASLPLLHHDLEEYRNTPGFFLVYPDGTVEAGKQ